MKLEKNIVIDVNKPYSDKNEMTKLNLFSLPIHQIKIDPKLYDKEKILSDIEYNKSLQNTRNATHQRISRYNSDIHHSFNDFDNKDFRIINYKKLIEVYHKVFTDFFNNQLTTVQPYEWKFYIANYTAMTEGQWLPSHGHLLNWSLNTDNAFACIHYLNFKKEHSPTTFENPANFAEFTQITQPELLSILDITDSENSYLHETWEVSAEEDSMIIFPAGLKHEVKVQGPTKESRITISSNIEISRS